MNKVVALNTNVEDNGRTVLVYGCGAGGLAMAVDLARNGWRVLVSDPFQEHIVAAGTLSYVGVAGEGTVAVEETDLSLEDAVTQASLVVVATLATFVEEIVSQLGPALGERQTVVAACGGLVSLALEHAIDGDAKPLFGELACFPYSARFTADGALNIRRRRPVRLAATNEGDTAALIEALPKEWVGPDAVSVLHAAILNPNYIVHPAAVVINAASRDRGENVPHEGLTRGARLLAGELDRDKCGLLKSLSIPIVSFEELVDEMVLHGEAAPMSGTDAFEPILDRYLHEDCGMGLSLLSALAQEVDVATPTISAIKAVLEQTYSGELPTFPFDLIGLTPAELVASVNRGDSS